MPQTGILFFENRRFNQFGILKLLSENKSAKPEICFQTKKFITIHAYIFIIHWSDIPALSVRPRCGYISSILCEPRARLCRMVDAIRLDNSLSITTTGNKPFSR